MNLATAFTQTALQRPQKTALFWGEQEFTYTVLHDQSLAVARQLVEQFEVKPGDRVALWLKNRPEFIPAFFGIVNAGAVVVPINNFLKPAEVNYIVSDSGADLLITDDELGGHHPELAAARPTLKMLKVEEFSAEGRGAGSEDKGLKMEDGKNPPSSILHSPASSPKESDLAVIIYTSGTTGRPKGAMLSHGNLLHNVESCRLVLESVHEDRVAVLLPLFHTYMLTVGMLLPLIVGGSMVLVRSLSQPHHILKEIISRQATILPAIPQFYRTLANLSGPLQLPFRICVCGAAPLPVQVLRDFEAKYHIPLIEGYGLSEASPVVTKNPLHAARKAGSIGLPIPNVEVCIQDEAGRELGTGEVGEVCVRGGNVMSGYWNNPDESARAMRGDWLLTGDIGYRDAEGYYFITDRKKDMLLVNGINVYPREIEEVIHHFPGIKEAAVIGVPDARRGEQPVAFVAMTEGVTLDEKALLKLIRQKLADYKVPRHVTVLAALPRNATGKILKTALRTPAAAAVKV